jgi:hypothetical protein
MALKMSHNPEKDADKVILGKHGSDEESQTRRPSVVGDVVVDRATIGKQLALEAESAIKYRTCSWQKVSLVNPVS